ncbi:hypothetical protein GCM10009733_063750 [Nonomuraea maheshkhaliensis]|uniref:Uncharacterized protein n=1 Tax=Nonomuraea maheshkhaliensis TaxID=419590 RepID=A0ABN2FSJ6_9ACTN
MRTPPGELNCVGRIEGYAGIHCGGLSDQGLRTVQEFRVSGRKRSAMVREFGERIQGGGCWDASFHQPHQRGDGLGRLAALTPSIPPSRPAGEHGFAHHTQAPGTLAQAVTTARAWPVSTIRRRTLGRILDAMPEQGRAPEAARELRSLTAGPPAGV